MSQSTMKALVKRHAEPGIWMEEVPVPEVGPNEVLIKIEKTAICGTDLHIYKWDEWSQRTIKPGLTIGHEFVGRIVEIGPGVTGYNIGDRVSAEGHIVCGHCRNCRAGRQHLCPNTVGIGVNRNGAFAEYMTMPASQPVADPGPDPVRAGRLLRPVRQRRALRAGVRRDRRGRADHRRRPDRHHRRRHLQAHRRAQRGGHRRQRLPPEAGRRHGRHPRGERRQPVAARTWSRTCTSRASTWAWR